MNYRTKHNRNQEQMENFIDFLPLCENLDDKLKLLGEINRLREQNERISNMTVKGSAEDTGDYFLQINSKIN